MKAIHDLYRLKEDDRLKLIADTASTGALVGVILERDEPEKIERYIKGITELGARLVDRQDGPTAGTVLLRFGPKETQ